MENLEIFKIALYFLGAIFFGLADYFFIEKKIKKTTFCLIIGIFLWGILTINF